MQHDATRSCGILLRILVTLQSHPADPESADHPMPRVAGPISSPVGSHGASRMVPATRDTPCWENGMDRDPASGVHGHVSREGAYYPHSGKMRPRPAGRRDPRVLGPDPPLVATSRHAGRHLQDDFPVADTHGATLAPYVQQESGCSVSLSTAPARAHASGATAVQMIVAWQPAAPRRGGRKPRETQGFCRAQLALPGIQRAART
jgi:hypothetical protein